MFDVIYCEAFMAIQENHNILRFLLWFHQLLSSYILFFTSPTKKNSAMREFRIASYYICLQIIII